MSSLINLMELKKQKRPLQNQDAMIVSRTGVLEFAEPMPAEQALLALEKLLKAVAERIGVDGAVLGHIKGLCQCTAGKAAMSITRLEYVDKTYDRDWQGCEEISSYQITVNVLSLANTNAPIDDLLNQFFQTEMR